jgi:hypothetical protein
MLQAARKERIEGRGEGNDLGNVCIGEGAGSLVMPAKGGIPVDIELGHPPPRGDGTWAKLP